MWYAVDDVKVNPQFELYENFRIYAEAINMNDFAERLRQAIEMSQFTQK
jgi:hypothetical protein